MKMIRYLAVLMVAMLAVGSRAYAAEHPSEHPESHAAEHPTKEAAQGISKDDLAEAIKSYVEKDSELKGGYFLVYDKEAGKTLALSLKKVHKDRLSTIGDGVYFACADFETPEGKIYDLDIFMKGSDKDNLKVQKIMVHKEAGAERYTWYEEDGIWKTRHMEGSHMKDSEHSAIEHPKMQHEGSMMKGGEGEDIHPR